MSIPVGINAVHGIVCILLSDSSIHASGSEDIIEEPCQLLGVEGSSSVSVIVIEDLVNILLELDVTETH